MYGINHHGTLAVVPWSAVKRADRPVGLDKNGLKRSPPNSTCRHCKARFIGWGRTCTNPECEDAERVWQIERNTANSLKGEEERKKRRLKEIAAEGITCNNPACKRKHARGASVKGSCCVSCFEIVTKHKGVINAKP